MLTNSVQKSNDILFNASDSNNETVSLLVADKRTMLEKIPETFNDTEVSTTTSLYTQQEQSTTVAVDEVIVVIIPNTNDNLTKVSNESSSDKPSDDTSKVSSNVEDFNKTRLRDSFVLSSRLYLTPNNTGPKTSTDNENTLKSSLRVDSIDIEPLNVGPSQSNQNTDD